MFMWIDELFRDVVMYNPEMTKRHLSDWRV
jgi:hypothetical protein